MRLAVMSYILPLVWKAPVSEKCYGQVRMLGGHREGRRQISAGRDKHKWLCACPDRVLGPNLKEPSPWWRRKKRPGL